MSITKKIAAVLQGAEKSLVALASEAAGARDYELASAIIQLAREIELLPKRYPNVFVSDGVAEKATPAAASPAPVSSSAIARVSSPKKGTYPQFARDGDSLIKIGWSKADKAEYQHKSPKAVLDTLVVSLEKLGSGGKVFAMDSVIPLSSPTDGSEIPPYQAYLCLAWLRDVDAILQHGRRGYSLRRDRNLSAMVDEAWRAMPAR